MKTLQQFILPHAASFWIIKSLNDFYKSLWFALLGLAETFGMTLIRLCSFPCSRFSSLLDRITQWTMTRGTTEKIIFATLNPMPPF